MPDTNEDITVEDGFVRLHGQRIPVQGEIPDEQARLRLEETLREARRQQGELEQKYPYMAGGRTVLGPEVSTDGLNLRWREETYVPQSHEKVLRDVRAVAAIHCSALLELLHDDGIRLPEPALRVYQLLYDELTLTMPALAQNHPAVVPRLPEGMK